MFTRSCLVDRAGWLTVLQDKWQKMERPIVSGTTETFKLYSCYLARFRRDNSNISELRGNTKLYLNWIYTLS